MMNLRIKGQSATPSLRFKCFSYPWKGSEIRQYASLVAGLTYTPSDVAPAGLLVLRSSNVQNGVIELNDNVFVNMEVADDTLSKPNDILVCVRNGSRSLIGKTALLPEGLPQSTHGAFMSIIRGKHNRFLFQMLQTSRYYRQVHINLGATINSINGSALRAFQFFFPSLPEQHKIATFLTAVDERIGQLVQKKALLEEYKKGVMQQLFTQALRFKDDNGKDFPHWQQKRYDSVYTFKNTNCYSRELLSYEEGEVRNIHYGDIHTKFRSNFYLSQELVPFIKPEVNLKRIADECYCREGDLVIADASEDYADVGKCIEIRDLAGQRTLAGLHTFIARPKKGTMAPGFGAYLMQSREMRLKIMRIAQGTKVLAVSKPMLSKLTLPIPTLPEQTKIANFLTALDRKIESVATQITETQTFKKGLLQQMFV